MSRSTKTPEPMPSLFDAGPSLDAVLQTILDVEPLEATAQKLGVSRTRLVRILKSAMAADAETPAIQAAPERPTSPAATPAPAPAPTPAEAPKAHTHPATHKKVRMYFDGASRGNPGPSGAGAVLYDERGKVLRRAGKFLGVQTNNVAEYSSAILGLEKALELGATELEVRADSMLAIMQLKGAWKVKHEGLKPLHQKAAALLTRFHKVDLAHVPREMNGPADEMSNRAIDERMDGSEFG